MQHVYVLVTIAAAVFERKAERSHYLHVYVWRLQTLVAKFHQLEMKI